jgi:hypothetical protein
MVNTIIPTTRTGSQAERDMALKRTSVACRLNAPHQRRRKFFEADQGNIWLLFRFGSASLQERDLRVHADAIRFYRFFILTAKKSSIERCLVPPLVAPM